MENGLADHNGSLSSATAESASSNGNNEEVGPSKKQLTRAEEIQLEADRIPSVKTCTWNPFTLFPEEIWEIIFANLTDSKDMENVINATPEWGKMCRRKMPTVLLQQALSIMEKQKDEDGESLLKKEDYFPCRFVCKSWDQSVQNFIQWHPVHFDMALTDEHFGRGGPLKLNKYESQLWQKNSFKFSGYHEPEFSEEMAKTHPHPFDRNPFLSRQITISGEELDEYFWRRRDEPSVDLDPDLDIAVAQEFRSRIASILEKYGRHVWECTINFRVNLTPFIWYDYIEYWISLMQNLKVLNLEYETKEYESFSERRQNHTTLENQIGISPLSELKDLTFLKTKDVPGPVFNELISQATNLQKLCVKFGEGKSGTRLTDYQFSMMASQNLTECYLTLLCAEDFTHLESMGGSWPLKELYLQLNYGYEDRKKKLYPTWPEWDRTFKFIGEKFGSTLLGLRLQLAKATKPEDMKSVLEESPHYRLNLPHVKSLRVVVPNLTSYDFLLPMRSLEQLCVVVDYQEPSGNIKKKDLNGILKFTDNFHQLSKTNIWEVLPKLKRVKLYIPQRIPPGNYGHWRRPTYATHIYDKETMDLVEVEVSSDSE